MWVVDTCVILDILDGHPQFARLSADAIDNLYAEGLVVAPITYVELAPAFNGDAAAQDKFLQALGIRNFFGVPQEAIMVASRAWHRHILRKRAGVVRKRPIADVMIGAYACMAGGLVTRNEADFRILYPDLPIFNPAQSVISL